MMEQDREKKKPDADMDLASKDAFFHGFLSALLGRDLRSHDSVRLEKIKYNLFTDDKFLGKAYSEAMAQASKGRAPGVGNAYTHAVSENYKLIVRREYMRLIRNEAATTLEHDRMILEAALSAVDNARMNMREMGADVTCADRHERVIAQILTHFRNLIFAASESVPKSATVAQASLNSLVMDREVAVLIHEVQNLLTLTREIKTLWIHGNLNMAGDAANQVREQALNEKAAKVQELYNTISSLKNKVSSTNSNGLDGAATATSSANQDGGRDAVNQQPARA
ncbi:hypothetical protein F5Y16DRAFT_419905 [Xylariaceae sp. FL0255]|nr:hypothetical protein F5Y16DRAFT_419905 [Xylariaceae sp. FL0255]